MKKSAVILPALFGACIFVTSDDGTLRVMSMTACNFLALAMLGSLVLGTLAKRKVRLADDPLLLPTAALIVWAGASLVVARINPATNIPIEAYSFSWTTGLNAPELRGIAFLMRLMLSFAAYHYILQSASKTGAYVRIVKVFLWAYTIFCTVTVSQLIAYHAFGITIGNLFIADNGSVRIGSYVGEPSVLSGILASGFFLVAPWTSAPKDWPRLPPFIRWYTFVCAAIGLAYALSASVLTGMLLAYILTGRNRRSKMAAAVVIASVLIVSQSVYSIVFNSTIATKIHNELTSVNIRTLSWIIGWRMWLTAPISGVGIGQSPFFIGRYIPTDIDIPFNVRLYYDYASMRHLAMNTYIEWLSETGAVGIALLGLVAYRAFQTQQRQHSESSMVVRESFGTSVITLLIAANSFPDAFFLSHFVFVLAMYFGGLRAYGTSADADTAGPGAAMHLPTPAR